MSLDGVKTSTRKAWAIKTHYHKALDPTWTDRKPLVVRLSLNARDSEDYPLEGAYLLVTGLYKLLEDLDVIAFRHGLLNGKLFFFLEMNESIHALKDYLQQTLRWHILGQVWKLAILDSDFPESPLIIYSGQELLDGEEMSKLAHIHMEMGSRPLRFSRYFLYSSLAPYLRTVGLGCPLLDQADSRGEGNFYQALRGFKIIQDFFSSQDFSATKDLDDLRLLAEPCQKALDQVTTRSSFMEGLLFNSLVLAMAYEKKLPSHFLQSFLKSLAWPLGRQVDAKQADFWANGGMRGLALDGYGFLLNDCLPLWQDLRKGAQFSMNFYFETAPIRFALNDLGYYIFRQVRDPKAYPSLGPRGYERARAMALKAIQGGQAEGDDLDRFLRKKGVTAYGVGDLISMTLLLEKLILEEKEI